MNLSSLSLGDQTIFKSNGEHGSHDKMIVQFWEGTNTHPKEKVDIREAPEHDLGSRRLARQHNVT